MVTDDFEDRTNGGRHPDDESDEIGPKEMAQIVTHDLRNPLDVANAHLQAGRETGDDQHFETVARAHNRMEQIIQDVLTLASEESAVDPSQTADLLAIVESAWETVDTGTAILSIESQLPHETIDSSRVERLFENLFRNAVDHGGPSPAIRVGQLVTDNTDGVFVADDGPGVPQRNRERIFEAGYTTTEHGTGWGLAIVDRIARAHGWDVQVTTSSDRGARFEVRFSGGQDKR